MQDDQDNNKKQNEEDQDTTPLEGQEESGSPSQHQPGFSGLHPSERVLGVNQSQNGPVGPGGFSGGVQKTSTNEDAGEGEQNKDTRPQDNPPSQPASSGSETESSAPSRPSSGQDAGTEQLEKELAEMKDKYVRAVAEAENVRKRTSRERQDISKYAISSFAKDLLDFADNFRRGIESLPEDLKQTDERIKNTLDGIEAMERELLKIFEKHGIQKMEPMDQKFDPNFHEVMFETPSEGKEPGTIVHLVEAGYMLHDRLLRPARVGVAKDDGTQADTPPPGGQNLDEEI